jgi:hypothetical protein
MITTTQSDIRNSLAITLAVSHNNTGSHEVAGARLDVSEEKTVFAMLRIATDMAGTYETDAALQEGIRALRTQLTQEKHSNPTEYTKRVQQATTHVQAFTDHIKNLKNSWAQQGV